MKRIYLVRNNETGAEDLVRARSGGGALRYLLEVRDAYSVKIPNVEEALAIQKTGQEVLDEDDQPTAVEEIAQELGIQPADVMKDPFAAAPSAASLEPPYETDPAIVRSLDRQELEEAQEAASDLAATRTRRRSPALAEFDDGKPF